MKKAISILMAMLFAGWQTASAQEIMIFDGKAIPVEQVDSITAGRTSGNVIGDQLWRNEQLSIFASALKATGIEDSLCCYLRDDYKETGWEGEYYSGRFREWQGIMAPVPHHRYTVFIEPDSVYKANGIGSLDDLRAYAKKVYDEVFPEDASVQDEKDPRNSLHRFVAYHVLEYGAPLNQYAAGDGGTYATPVYRNAVQHVEYYQTLMPEALLKISRPPIEGKEEFYLNRKSVFDDQSGSELTAQMQESDYGVHVDAASAFMPENGLMNGYVYALGSILVYDKKTVDQRSSERLRFDMAALSPEMMANNLRLNRGISVYYFPKGYFKNFSWDERISDFMYAPNQGYSNGLYSWQDLYGDECVIRGIADFTITLPVVPAGTYELRTGQWVSPNRGQIQYYIDGDPCGEPVDMTKGINYKEIGWLSSSERNQMSEEELSANWSQMRSNGWMYAPHWIALNYSNYYMDESQNCLRRIIGTFTSDGKTAHTVRMQQTLDYYGSETFLDYLELCPECIYANPDKMEDKW